MNFFYQIEKNWFNFSRFRMETTTEFAVEMTCNSCVVKTEKVLSQVDAISDYKVSVFDFVKDRNRIISSKKWINFIPS